MAGKAANIETSAVTSATEIRFVMVIIPYIARGILGHGKEAYLHIAPVLPAHLKQGIGDLTQRTHANGVHQHFKHIPVVDHGLLQSGKHGRGLLGVALLEISQSLELALLFLVGRAGQFQLVLHGVAMRIAEGIDANNGQLAGVLEFLPSAAVIK